MLTEKSLVRFYINGIIKDIEKLQEFVRITLISYTNQSPNEIPIYIRVIHWEDSFKKGSPIEMRGILGSVKDLQSTSPVLIADSIFHRTESEVKQHSPTNTIAGEIFLIGDPKIITTVHPHHAFIYAGTGALRLGPSFYGYRYNFELRLLRKNIAMAKTLRKGDVIKFTGVITHKEGYGEFQIVAKEFQKLPNNNNNNHNNHEFKNARELA